MSGVEPEWALEEGLKIATVAYTLRVDGEVAAIAGVAPIAGHALVGAVWMLGTPLIERVTIPFLRASRAGVDHLHDFYPALVNVADARNTVHLKWLRWCGFHFIRRHETYGPAGVPAIEFARIKNP